MAPTPCGTTRPFPARRRPSGMSSSSPGASRSMSRGWRSSTTCCSPRAMPHGSRATELHAGARGRSSTTGSGSQSGHGREGAEEEPFDADTLWAFAAGRRTRVPTPQRRFLEGWSRGLAETGVRGAADDAQLRRLVRDREIQLKRGRARLKNPARLLEWGGNAGVGRMEFRWGTVRRLPFRSPPGPVAGRGARVRPFLMLSPDSRTVATELLRPPPGYRLDHAVLTTYTLDLETLLALPFGVLSRSDADLKTLLQNPLRLLETLRNEARRFHVFVDHGGIAIPGSHRTLYGMLEPSVHPVRAPNGGVFHPKVWLARFAPTDGEGAALLRVGILSRNLTGRPVMGRGADERGLPRRGIRSRPPDRSPPISFAPPPGARDRGAARTHRDDASEPRGGDRQDQISAAGGLPPGSGAVPPARAAGRRARTVETDEQGMAAARHRSVSDRRRPRPGPRHERRRAHPGVPAGRAGPTPRAHCGPMGRGEPPHPSRRRTRRDRGRRRRQRRFGGPDPSFRPARQADRRGATDTT